MKNYQIELFEQIFLIETFENFVFSIFSNNFSFILQIYNRFYKILFMMNEKERRKRFEVLFFLFAYNLNENRLCCFRYAFAI